MNELIERYCVYEPSTNEILRICGTKEEALSDTKYANVFRKMVGEEPLMAGKVALTVEELELFAEMEK